MKQSDSGSDNVNDTSNKNNNETKFTNAAGIQWKQIRTTPLTAYVAAWKIQLNLKRCRKHTRTEMWKGVAANTAAIKPQLFYTVTQLKLRGKRTGGMKAITIITSNSGTSHNKHFTHTHTYIYICIYTKALPTALTATSAKNWQR